MKYKLLINGSKLDEYSHISDLVIDLLGTVKPGDRVEVWERRRIQWQLESACVWRADRQVVR